MNVSDSLLEKRRGSWVWAWAISGTGGWKRGADLLARLVGQGSRGVRVRRLGGDRAGEIRFTRFLRSASVTLDEMTATAFDRTQVVCAG